MRASTLMIAALVIALSACAGAANDFEADYSAARADVATLKGGAFDRAVRLRLGAKPLQDAAAKCLAQNKPAAGPAYRGVIRFDGSRGYTVRYDHDDALARCLVDAFEGKDLPEPPDRPFLVPIEFSAPQEGRQARSSGTPKT